MIDADSYTFTVLDFVTIKLFGGYLWQGEDIEDLKARGSAFFAFDDPPTESVASFTIVDVTNDPDEPNINLLDSNHLDKIDAQLKAAVYKQKDVVNWMSSKLNGEGEKKSLITPYISKDKNREWQYIDVRLNKDSRKIVVVGMFDTSMSDPLARLIFGAIQSIKLG